MILNKQDKINLIVKVLVPAYRELYSIDVGVELPNGRIEFLKNKDKVWTYCVEVTGRGIRSTITLHEDKDKDKDDIDYYNQELAKVLVTWMEGFIKFAMEVVTDVD
jgi:hypothetical protein